jgi:hypothetical protein
LGHLTNQLVYYRFASFTPSQQLFRFRLVADCGSSNQPANTGSAPTPTAIYFTRLSSRPSAQAECAFSEAPLQTNRQIKAIVENASETGKLGGAWVDSALSLHELIQPFGGGLVRQDVPQRARPFRTSALVNLGWIRSAANYRREWLLLIEWSNMPQSQCFLRALRSVLFSHPPCNQFKYGRQIDVDCVSLPASLAFVMGRKRAAADDRSLLVFIDECPSGLQSMLPARATCVMKPRRLMSNMGLSFPKGRRRQ